MHDVTPADLDLARGGLLEAERALEAVALRLADRSTGPDGLSMELLDEHQVTTFDLATLSSEHQAALHLVAHAQTTRDTLDMALACGYAADVTARLRAKVQERAPSLGLVEDGLFGSATRDLMQRWLAPARVEGIARLLLEQGHPGTDGLGEEHRIVQDAFRTYSERSITPIAEGLHRADGLIPEGVIADLAEQGCFGLGIPAAYGGFSDEPDHVAMVVATEELSKGALIAGSLITRPEILSKALLKGGTEEQKRHWLPLLASGERMAAVAVTEPDYGSDVAGLKVVARKVAGGYRITGTKTWCTFAGRAELLMVLARTDESPASKHRGLSLFIVEKPRFDGHAFRHDSPTGGSLEGRAIPTIGYRGMHSFEVKFEDLFVPEANLIGGTEGLGKGFYLQMEGFSGGRLQTAARALGVMRSAFEHALRYSTERSVFGRRIADYPLTRHKLARMAMLIAASRQFTYHTARLMDRKEGQTQASMVKLMACRMAEGIAREAQQLHGGMGYAEEFAVSRLFVDSRVLSIFEGAEEVLALRVIAPALIKAAGDKAASTTGGHR